VRQLAVIAASAAALLATFATSATFMARPAQANGRFPTASQLVIRPGHPEQMALRTTFGVLVSSDRAATWSFICEAAVGYQSSEDPALSMTGGGTLLASTGEGLAVSADGCAWGFASGGLANQVVVDSAVRASAPQAAVVVTSTPTATTDAGTSVQSVQIFATDDDGSHWTMARAALDSSVVPTSVEVAASDPHRIYVTTTRGARPSATASLFVSTDDGAHWTERAIPVDGTAGESAYIAAVDPTRADRVYVRTMGSGKSRLFVTDDAGMQFRAVYSGGPMLGFALSSDSATVYLGGPEDGLQAASTNDLAFTQRSPIPVGCLAVSGARIYACVVQSSVLVAASDDGTSFAPVLRLADVRGPLTCPAASSTAACAADWTALSERFGLGVSDGGADAAADSITPPAPSSGCGHCAATSAPIDRPSTGAAALTVALVGLAAARARHRRARRGT
jgi:hypothetical protein